MKKITVLLLAVLMMVALFAGCKSDANTGDTLKTGLAVINSIAKSTSADNGDGLAEANSTFVAVTVDGAGKIVSCVIDAVQSKVNFDATGVIVTPLDTTFKTKNERGTGYNMKGSSSIGKEWNEQAAAFAQYVVGKTVSEVKGIALSNSGVPTGSDLTSSVTIHVTEFISGIEKAVANATDLGAKVGDKLSIAAITNIEKSKNATADAAGQVQVYSTYAALTKDSSGKITSCVFDSSQSNINFDATGKITSDLAVAPKTKNELKEAYNLGKSSSIGKEWYQQAASFASYVKGKTAAEVKGIALSDAGAPTGSDLTSSVTITVTDFIELVEKAAG